MRKIVMMNRISLDGYFAGPNGEIDWFIHDPEVDQAAHKMMQPDTLLLGRLTYQMFENYWVPVGKDADAPQHARATSNELTQMNKIVFSNTLNDVTWENTQLVKENPIKTVQALKQGEGADITIFGSGAIVQQLMGENLIDEYLLILTPVVLGAGKPLFKDASTINLELIESTSFDSGNLLLHYTLMQR